MNPDYIWAIMGGVSIFILLSLIIIGNAKISKDLEKKDYYSEFDEKDGVS